MEEGNESSRDGRVMISWPLMTRWRRAAIQSSADDLSQCVYVTKRGNVMCVCRMRCPEECASEALRHSLGRGNQIGPVKELVYFL